MSMAGKEEWKVQDVIEEVDEYYNRLLHDLDTTTLMGEDVDNESGSQNWLRGVDIKNSSKEKQGTTTTRERSRTTREAQYSGRSRHEQAVSITTRPSK